MAPNSRLIVGTLNFSRMIDEDDSLAILRAALDVGVSAINTSDSDYSGRSEEIVGAHIRSLPKSQKPWIMLELSGEDMGVPHRPNLSPTYLRKACERSLGRLGVEQVDRVVVPRPSFDIPLEETLDGINRLILEPGLANSYGLSTFPAWLTCHAQHVTRANSQPPPVSELAPYNLLDRRVENEILPNCRFWGMEFYAWAPLAQGLLAGRYPATGGLPIDSRAFKLKGIYEERVSGRARQVAHEFSALALSWDIRPGPLAIAWLLAQDGLTGAVFGPRHATHVIEAAASLDQQITAEMTAKINDLFPKGGATADFFNTAPWMLQSTVRSRTTVE